MILVVYVFLPRRDNEKAYVTANDKTCWTKNLSAPHGSQQCGASHDHWLEDSLMVLCEARSVAGKLTVRVFTTLDSSAYDESFAIDNVDVRKIAATQNAVTKEIVSGMMINVVSVSMNAKIHFGDSFIKHAVDISFYCNY